MLRKGLIAKKILVSSRGKQIRRTYWVKPFQLPQNKENKPSFENKTTTSDYIPQLDKRPSLVSEKQVVSHVKPVRILFDSTPLQQGSHPQETLLINEENLKKQAKIIHQAFGGNGLGVDRIVSVKASEDPELLEGSVGYYRRVERVVAIEQKFVNELHQAAKQDHPTTDNEELVVSTILHESLHAATGKGQLVVYEGIQRTHRPYAAIEEGTTEILTQFYQPGYQKALLGGDAKPENTSFLFTAKYQRDSEARDVFVDERSTYQNEVTQFARVACFLEKLDVTTPTKSVEVVRAATYHAGEIKKRTLSQGNVYRYLGEKAIGVFGLPSAATGLSRAQLTRYKELKEKAVQEASQKLQSFMQADRYERGSIDLQYDMQEIAFDLQKQIKEEGLL